MNNLTTQKIVLGMLMVLVLALGVQGSADAITKFTRGAGDLKMYAENQPFTVSFSVGAQSPKLKPGRTSIPSTLPDGVSVTDGHSYYTEDTTQGFQGTEPTETRAAAHYYDEESINITVSGATITRVGSYDGTFTSPHAMSDGGTNAAKLSNSVTLTLRASGAGEVTITISDETAAEDREGAEASDLVFKVYIVENPVEVNAAGLDLLGAGNTTNYLRGLDDFTDPDIGASLSTGTHVKIKYDVVSGSGQVYVTEDGRIGPKGRSVTTSSTATAQLDMNGTTNKVTVTVVGSNTYLAPVTAFFIYGLPQLEATQGSSGQKGATGGRLEDPLGIRVKDGKGRTISGLGVTFTTGATGAEFIPIPSMPETMYTFVSTSPQTITVETNNSGIAETYYQLGSEAGMETITTTAAGVTRSENTALLTATAESITSVPNIEIVSGNNQRTDDSGDLKDPLVVKVTRRGRRVAGTQVTFTANRGLLTNTPPTGTDPNSNVTVTDDTDAQGLASVTYLLLDHSGAVEVVASISGSDPTTYRRTATFGINGGRSTSGGGEDETRDPPPTITRTLDIDVSGTGSTREVTVTALENGVSQTGFSVSLSVSGAASLSETSGATPLESTLTLPSTAGDYTLRASTTASGYSAVTEDVTVTLPGTLAIRLVDTQVNGAQTIQVTARNAAGSLETTAVTVTLSGAGISRTLSVTGSQNIPITLPTTSGTLFARATGYNTGSVPLPARSTTTTTTTDTTTTTTDTTTTTTEDTPEPSRIQIGGQSTRTGTANTQLDSPLLVRVLDEDGDPVADARVIFRVRTGQGRLQQLGNGRARAVQTDSSGYARAPYTPISASSTVEAEVRGVSRTVTFTITTDGSAPAATGTPGATRTYKAGDRIPLSLTANLSFSGSRTVSGTTYTCVGPGECVVSHGILTKGEIQSAAARTVQSKVYRVGEKIPLSLTANLSFSGSRTVSGTTYTCVGSDECVVSYGLVTKGQIRSATSTGGTPGTTGINPGGTPRTTEINPVVHVAAAQRPPMVWVDGGAIYALVGASPERFAPGVENAVNIAVGGNKVYWTEQTGASAGTINSANLDASGAKELAAIKAVPLGVAVDTTGGKLYWTNSRGRIQSANLDGSRITNELQNLEGVMDITLAGGNAYWTQGGNVRFVNLKGQKQIRNISTGTDTAGSLAIGGGKVYWTEKTGENGGTVNSANLNGTGAKQLASILAAPMGIAVDAARSKLYWGNARGRIQSANLDGSKIQNVVDGLGSPGDMVLSNSLKAPAGTTTAPRFPTTAANKYDVNGDGTVDSKDSDALVVAVSAGITDAKYDVNGDGKVDITDVVAVSANRSSGAASAPALIGNIKLSAIQIDRLQEQIELLIATGDRSPAAMKTLIYLQQLIALARPEQTQLFANYPNPFNPETWMPYELATDTNVRITIYNAQGVVIRTLALGHQSAGYYTDRERAAYWDGKNAQGEQVASGVYFYQFETDALSLMRKMVILK